MDSKMIEKEAYELQEITDLAIKVLTENEIQILNLLAAQQISLQILREANAPDQVKKIQRKKINKIKKKMKEWEKYQERKTIIWNFVKACRYQYLLNKIAKESGEMKNRYIRICKKNFPKGF